MKTALKPLLIIVSGIISCAASTVTAQDYYPGQLPPANSTAAPNSLPHYDAADANGGQMVNGNTETATGSQQTQSGMPNESLMIDNGLWLDADVGPCCSVCGGGSNCPPDWYVEQGIRLMTRSRPRDLPIASSYNPSTGVLTGVLSSRTAAPDLGAMYYTTLGHYFARDKKNRNHFVEFTFWGLNGWKDNAVRRSQGNLYSEYYLQGYYLDGFYEADLQSTYYASYTNNFEVNGRIVPRGRPDRLVMQPNGKWRRECQPGTYMSFLYGIRVFQENETFQFHSQGTSNSITYTGDYNIATHNVLLGFQFGTDLTFRQCRWEWGFRTKLGPYLNFADQQSEIDSGPALAPTFSRRLSAAKHEASLLGEVGFFASYKFYPNMIGKIGYDFMWVTGMSLAPEQLQFTTNTINQVNTNGTILYHGITASMEWRW